jgi:adsorption protein B
MGLRAANRTAVILAAGRAVSIHLGGGPVRWDKTTHIFPTELAR